MLILADVGLSATVFFLGMNSAQFSTLVLFKIFQEKKQGLIVGCGKSGGQNGDISSRILRGATKPMARAAGAVAARVCHQGK